MNINKIIEYFKTPRNLSLAVLLICTASLATAYISQYVFGLQPCQLCLYQRCPYALNIVFSFFAFMATYKYPKLVTRLLWLAVASFLIGAAIAFFHAGVEYKWWEYHSSCTDSGLPTNGSIEDLRAMIASRETVVRCDEPQWTLFDISMAGYNFIASSMLAISLSYMLLSIKNKK